MILGMKQKNQFIWTTRCKVMAKHISIYFDIFQQKLGYIGLHRVTSKNKLFREGFVLDQSDLCKE